MEDLHISYKDIMEMEYSLLLMMQYDKPRVDYTDEKDRVNGSTGSDMLKRKRGQ